jgi:3'-5' exoribonuclease
MRKRIADLGDKDRVKEVYLCTRKTLPVDRNGKRYLNLVLGDRTGEVEALLWTEPERQAEKFSVQDLVEVVGTAILFQGRLQLHLQEVSRSDGRGIPRDEFLRRSTREPERMLEELSALLAGIEEPHLAALARSLLGDRALLEALSVAPAAKSIHHAFVGGLLEHTLSVVQLADVMCRHYAVAIPGLLDRDLCLLGAFLHDLGKLEELGREGVFEYTDRGRLLGHIVLGTLLLDERIRRIPDFPVELADELRHILLSHHGRLEHGSPKVPMTAEASLVHRLDEIDSFLAGLREILAQPSSDGRWTPYQPLHERHFYRGARPAAARARGGSQGEPDGA